MSVYRIMLEIKPTLHCILRELLGHSSSVIFLVVGYGSGGLIPRLPAAVIATNAEYSERRNSTSVLN